MQTAIIIPARYHSTRLPGKPLVEIANKSMICRVIDVANLAASQQSNISVFVSTDDKRIAEHVTEYDTQVIMTDAECPSGTDRVLSAIEQLEQKPDIVINLQGDNPLIPEDFITKIVTVLKDDPKAQIATPVVQLSWENLAKLRSNKQTTPFSGTTAILDNDNNAIWFSKQIIPAIRNEDKLRQSMKLSPVYRHIGLYGYRYEALKRYSVLPESYYEKLEGLEQLRALENGMVIKAVKVSYHGKPEMSGIDTQEDVERANLLLAEQGK